MVEATFPETDACKPMWESWVREGRTRKMIATEMRASGHATEVHAAAMHPASHATSMHPASHSTAMHPTSHPPTAATERR